MAQPLEERPNGALSDEEWGVYLKSMEDSDLRAIVQHAHTVLEYEGDIGLVRRRTRRGRRKMSVGGQGPSMKSGRLRGKAP